MLHGIVSAEVIVGANCARHLNHGWNPVEDWHGRAVRWTSPRAALSLRAPCDEPVLRLEVWAGPAEVVYPRELEVIVAGVGASPRRRLLLLEPDRWLSLTLDGVEARAGQVVTVTLGTPEPIRPSSMSEGSSDERDLGVALRRIGLHEPGADRSADARLSEADPPSRI